MHNYSPLRYPGGKARLADYFKAIFVLNDLMDGSYVEPYAGGASVGLALLFGDYARRIHINDIDPSIHAFWHCVLHRTDELCRLVRDTPLTVEQWRSQRDIYRSDEKDPLLRGFATFFLNRTNRSGIIGNGGVIGGLQQTGKWGIDARYPHEELVRRIEKIARYRGRITLTNLDGVALLEQFVHRCESKTLIYLDPPYYQKGQGLYANAYRPEDHASVAAQVAKLKCAWVVSYDDQEPLRGMYQGYSLMRYRLSYTAQNRYQGSEVMFFSPGLRLPNVDSPVRVTSSMVNQM